jgi:hypothetical protein
MKLFNPKAHSAAVYMPCWLVQIPTKLLSDGAKILYGRLAQWSSEKGIVYRSAPQLAEEIGKTTRSIERYLKELREVKLIETFQVKAGGENNFRFLDHEWIHADLNINLSYSKQPDNPPTQMSVPPDTNVGTPPTNVADYKYKEIKTNKRSFKTLVRNDEKPVVRTSATKNVSSSSSLAYSALFEMLYSHYPKQQQKQRAWKVFIKLNISDVDVLFLMDDIKERYKGVEKRFTPLLANYLSNNTWEDEIIKNTPSFKGIGVYDNNSLNW